MTARTFFARAFCFAAIAASVALGCMNEPPPSAPTPSVPRCPESAAVGCLTTRDCSYDAARQCMACYCGPAPFVPLGKDPIVPPTISTSKP